MTKVATQMTFLTKLAVVLDVARVRCGVPQEGPYGSARAATLSADTSLRVMTAEPIVNRHVARLIALPLGMIRTVAGRWCPGVWMVQRQVVPMDKAQRLTLALPSLATGARGDWGWLAAATLTKHVNKHNTCVEGP